MPTILISVDANSSNATAGIDKVASSLTGLDRSMGQAANSSTRMGTALSQQERALSGLDSAHARLESRIIRQNSLFDQAMRAAENYAQAQGRVTSGVDTSAAAVNRAESAFTRMISVQERAAMATQATASAYRTLAGAQDQVSRAGVRVAGAGSESAGGAGGHGGGFGESFLGSLLKYQLGFSALSQVTGQLTDAFTRTISTQRTLAMTQATTGISAQTTAQLGAYVQQQAGSGKQPFTSDVLASGLYAIPSAGVTDPTAIKAINDVGVKISAFTGSTDTGTVNTALIQTMTELGMTDKQMATSVGKVGDVITGIINLGIVAPNQVAPNVATFGSTAAQYGVDFGESGGIFAALTKTTRSADLAALDTSRIFSSIGAPNKQQQRQAAELGGSDLLGQEGIARLKADPRGYLQEVARITRLNPAADIAGIFGNRNAVQGIMGLVGPGGSSIGSTMATLGKVGARGSTDAASDLYSGSSAAKFDNASAQFKTAVDGFTTALVPFAAGALNLATATIGGAGKAGNILDAAASWARGGNGAGVDLNNVTGSDAKRALSWVTNGLIGGGGGGGSADMGAPLGYSAAWGSHDRSAPRAARAASSTGGFGIGAIASSLYAGAPDDVLTAQRQAARDKAAGISGGGGQHIGVNDAQDRLTLAIQGFGDKAKALGIYEQAVKDDPTISPVRRRLLDIAAEASVGKVVAGPAIKAFAASNPDLGGLVAGQNSTAVRFGGKGEDPLIAENRKLREEVKQYQSRNLQLLAQIAGYLKPSGNASHPNALTITGANRAYKGRG